MKLSIQKPWRNLYCSMVFKPIFMFLIIIYIIFVSTSIQVFASENDDKLIRVAFPIQEGLTEIDENGNYSGYTYDYLIEISQYTNWKYEFVQVEGDINTQLYTLMDKLISGEVDLMGSMLYKENLINLVDYPGYNYGITYSALYVLNENMNINSSNYTTFKELRVAVLDGIYVNKLDQFAQMNNIKLEKIFCSSQKEQMEMLKQNKVDAILNVDVNIIDKELRMLVRFAPEPFYLVASKKRSDIINGLNSAISNINETNPYFMTTLHEKYFSMDKNKLYLSKCEREYIEKKDTLKVGMLGGNAPIQYMDEDSQEIKGISKQVLDYISENTGLKFDIIYTDSSDEYNRLIENKEVDLVAGVVSNYEKVQYQDHYTTSVSYLNSHVMMVVNKNIDLSTLKEKRLAALMGDIDNKDYEDKKIYYNTVKECLDALNDGKSDYYYGNNYVAQYYINNQAYNNISIFPQSENAVQKISFGILKPIDINLISIINKSIQSISESELQNFLYENAFQIDKITLYSYIKTNPYEFILLVLVVIMIFISILLFYNAHSYKQINQQMYVENQRYEQMGELSNEFLYEYNILDDKLKVPEKCAQFLGCDREIENLSKKIETQNKENLNTNKLFEYIVSIKEGNKEILFCLANGKLHWLKIISKTILDSNNNPAYSIGKIVDIQKEKETQNKLIEKSQKDSLTLTYNSATIRQMITDTLKNSTKKCVGALFILDVDHFKNINDNFGHYTGDFVLVELSNILKNAVRKEDLVGRLGGDEFIIFMKHLEKEQIIIEKCNIICKRVKEIEIMGQKNLISVSIGVALAYKNQDYNDLYKNADKALYIVKKRGRNGFEII